MELTRLAIVYLHLIACCVALGLVLTSDIALVKQLWRGDAGRLDPDHMSGLQRTVSLALVALWITGLAVIAMDVSVKGWGYFANPKIQAKIGLVALLTVNGALLHAKVLPLLQRAGSLLRLSPRQRDLALFTGAVSGVTWFYAAFIGVGRPLAWKYSLLQLLGAYPVLIVGGFLSLLALTTWAKLQSEDRSARLVATV